MPTATKLLLLITATYLLTLLTLLHTFRLALDLSPGRRPQTSNASLSSANSSSFTPLSFTSALFNPKAIINNIFDPRPETSNGVSWLARLGWGLGEATVEVLESSPSKTFEARAAFFGRSIPEDGLVGWLVPLDSLFKPCSDEDSQDGVQSTETNAPDNQPNAHSPPLPSPLSPFFSVLDGAYIPLPVVDADGDVLLLESFPPEDAIPDNLENTGCPLQCPISEGFGSYQPNLTHPWPTASPAHPFPNTTWLALVRRGTCSFATKARFAESLGASGLLVGGFDESLISMSAGSGDGDIMIRSVFVGNRTYTELMGRVQESGVRLGVDGGAAEVGEGDFFGRSVKTILVRLEGEPPWEWYTPILSVLLVLSLPSLLTLCTLFVHRLRAERREREMRAPEDVVAGLPIRVWSGVRWEKDLERGETVDATADSPTESSPILPVRNVSKEGERVANIGYGTISDAEPSTSAPRSGAGPLSNVGRLGIGSTTTGDEARPVNDVPRAKQTSRLALPTLRSPTGKQHRQEESEETIPRPPWFTSQTECAICLCNFEIGDRVRVLPCGHVFHLDEVDPWLIKQRKVCPVCKYDVTNPPTALVPPSISPTGSPTMLPFDLQEPVPLPAVDSVDDTPGTESTPSSDSSAPLSQSHGREVTAVQLLASVDGRQRGWRHWLGRRLTPSTTSNDERAERRDNDVPVE